MQAKLLSFVSKFTCKYKLFLLAFCWSCFLALGITFAYHNQDISVSLMRSVACSKVSIVRLIVVSYIPFLAVALASRFRLLVFALFVCALKALGIGFVLASCCRGDRVTECAHSNVSIIENGVFVTAPTDNLILPGIARANLIKACHALGIPVSETPFTLDRLMKADEIIVSSSGSFCLSASHIDGIPVGGGAPELLEKLRVYLEADFINETTPKESI